MSSLLAPFFEACGPIAQAGKMSEDEFATYGPLVPPEIVELWEGGLGSYLNGFFWVVSPTTYQPALEAVYEPFLQPCTVFARTAFGDLFAWEKDCVKYVNVRHGKGSVQGLNLQVFFNRIVPNKSYFPKKINAPDFEAALQKFGPLQASQSYGYQPLLVAGGKDSIDSLQIVSTLEYLDLIAQMGGRIT